MPLRSLAVRVRVACHAAPILLCFSSHTFAEICESLTGLRLPNTTITLARVEEGDLSSIDNGTPGGSLTNLPSFCRVAGTISPVPDSAIKFEVWMPVSGWNRRFMEVGNGGYSGAPWIRFMAAAVRNGYATASTDTGHHGDAADASFALDHPEKIIDFGYRSEHETAVKAKAIIATFYDAPATKSYWDGCSSGGKQGLMEAQRYPNDFDGIIAGAPANNWERLTASAIWIEQATHLTPASSLPKEKLAILHQPPSTPATHPTASRMVSSETPSPATSIPQSPSAKARIPPPVSLPNKSKPRAKSTRDLSIPAPTKRSFPASNPAARSLGTPSPHQRSPSLPPTSNTSSSKTPSGTRTPSTSTATSPSPRRSTTAPSQQPIPTSNPSSPTAANSSSTTASPTDSSHRRTPSTTTTPSSRPPARRLPPPCASTWPPVWGTASAATAPTSISTHPSPPGSKTIRLPARSSPSTSPQTLHPPSPTAPVPSAPTPRLQSSKAAEAPTTPLASSAQSREFYLSPLLAHGAA